ncbi:glycosyltransferase [Enterococcus dongliensis]|uniref:glycosyltransferase n=1 Tax=Enterococcus dongliensis TaxID=2559925 RepID=UPI00288D38AE|nr:glycosyltransferase [Enterococcus dongliensis]MDT2634762.1 glycosyltransferase [Enterococcus dongliensis]MDT2669257.1 glycosyltransferase [Enterococcus dongliensis]
MLGITVIVPFYNAAAYIKKTMDRMKDWSYSNLEVIFVNDGSDDESEEIVRGNKNFDWKVVNQNNLGVSAARNKGFSLSSKEYIVFMDSDDFISDDFFMNVNTIFKENRSIDFIVSKFKYILEDGTHKILQDFNKFSGIITGNQALKLFFENRIGPVGRNVIFRKEFLLKYYGNKIFPEGRTKEDGATVYSFFGNSEYVYFLDTAFYEYLQRTDSIVHTYRFEDLGNVLQNSEETLEFVKEKNFEENGFLIATYNFLFHNIFQEYRKIVFSDVDRVNLKMIDTQIEYFIKTNIVKNNLGKKNKIKYILFKLKLLPIILTFKKYV